MSIRNEKENDDACQDFLDELGEIECPQSLQLYLNDPNLFEIGSNHNEILTDFNTNESIVSPETTSSLTNISSRILEIIAQPDCSTKARYRKDYLPPYTRRDPLGNKNTNSNYFGPTIQISPTYFQSKSYFIGISLVTLIYEQTQCCFIHPYELESIDHDDYNDRTNNIVWYPIETEDLLGIKCFSDLRVIRKTEDELQNYGDLRPFCISNVDLVNNSSQKILSKRQIVAHYNLKKARLAFFIGIKHHFNDVFPTMIDLEYLIYSDEFILIPNEKTNDPDKIIQSTVQSIPIWKVHRYVPHSGYVTNVDNEMLLSLTKKPEEKKYGKIIIRFQSIPPDRQWSIEIDTIEVKFQSIYFRIPTIPWSIIAPTHVNIIVQQGTTTVSVLTFTYIPQIQCTICQTSGRTIPRAITHMSSNKRTKASFHTFDDESDAIVPVSPTSPVLQQTTVEPEINSSNTIVQDKSSSNENLIMQKLNENMEFLFMHNDYQPILRTCRVHIQQRPKLLHDAIHNGYSELVSTFVPIGGMKLMQERNQYGETVLLHAIRLNHLNIVQAVLRRKESDKLLEDINEKQQNIFHILALNINSIEIVNFIIDHLLKIFIDIGKKFDHNDKDNLTPLQLAILHNNLPVTQQFLKYFNKDVWKTSDSTRDNLIHLSVRHGDLTMLKYLLNEGQMIEQGNQTNGFMTSTELAQSMNRTDMIDYLKTIYSQVKLKDNKDELLEQ